MHRQNPRSSKLTQSYPGPVEDEYKFFWVQKETRSTPNARDHGRKRDKKENIMEKKNSGKKSSDSKKKKEGRRAAHVLRLRAVELRFEWSARHERAACMKSHKNYQF